MVSEIVDLGAIQDLSAILHHKGLRRTRQLFMHRGGLSIGVFSMHLLSSTLWILNRIRTISSHLCSINPNKGWIQLLSNSNRIRRTLASKQSTRSKRSTQPSMALSAPTQSTSTTTMTLSNQTSQNPYNRFQLAPPPKTSYTLKLSIKMPQAVNNNSSNCTRWNPKLTVCRDRELFTRKLLKGQIWSTIWFGICWSRKIQMKSCRLKKKLIYRKIGKRRLAYKLMNKELVVWETLLMSIKTKIV